MIKKILKGKYKGLWLVRIQPMINGKRKSVTRRADSKLEAQKLEIDLKVKYASYKNGLPSITDESKLLIEYKAKIESFCFSIPAFLQTAFNFSFKLFCVTGNWLFELIDL